LDSFNFRKWWDRSVNRTSYYFIDDATYNSSYCSSCNRAWELRLFHNTCVAHFAQY